MSGEIKNGIRLLSPGALTTVQDYGRIGYGNQGFSPSGAVDRDAMELSNILVGNPLDEAVLESTLIGPTIEFLEDTYIALAGADMQAKIAETIVPMYQKVLVRAGDILRLGVAVNGCRGYIAIAGGLMVPCVLGSKSLHQKCGIGGGFGRPLQAGDTINIGRNRKKSSDNPKLIRKWLKKNEASYTHTSDKTKIVHIVMGPQDDMFTEDGKDTFLHSTYEIQNDSNRMACKMKGSPIKSAIGTDIISDGIALGSIQVASNGQPIVMLTDRQTTGGYAKIATVISTDIPIFAQCKPGDKISFQPVSLGKAHRIYRRKRRAIQKLYHKLEG